VLLVRRKSLWKIWSTPRSMAFVWSIAVGIGLKRQESLDTNIRGSFALI
jgi:hypothetical protein